jgi:hypothetical protein
MAKPSRARSPQPIALSTIFLAGTLAGLLDILDAFFFYASGGVKPIRILQSIAGGLLGPSAFRGGVATASLGAVLHFLIAVTAAAVYYAASRKIAFLRQHPIASGLLFGLAIYLVMNGIVLPLSAISPKPSYPTPILINGILAHLFCVGLPIALVVHRRGR